MCAGREGCGEDAGQRGECDGVGGGARAEGGRGSGYWGVEAFVRGGGARKGLWFGERSIAYQRSSMAPAELIEKVSVIY